MQKLLAGVATLALTAGTAHAVGLDRSNQDIGIIFQDGNYAELSYSFTMPEISGTDLATTGPTGNVANDFGNPSVGVKFQQSEQLSFALYYDQPYGVDIEYPVSATSVLLGGTAAYLESSAFNAIARYEFNENFSIHGGVRRETIEADITLDGLAYAGLAGYNVELASASGVGYAIGAAYERPDIALRVAVTYFSSITYEMDATESVGAATVAVGTTEIESPEAFNIDFQTGIAQDTLLFGQIRHAKYSSVIVSPDFFAGATGGASLTDIDDGTAYSIGIARRFNDQFAGVVSIGYEAEGDSNLVSPLAPTNGNTSLAVGGRYTLNDQVTLSGGVQYTWLGDAMPETGTPDVARGDFTDNSALSAGFTIGYSF